MSVSDIADLSSTEFRFVTKRDALPTHYIHFSLAPIKQPTKQSTNQPVTETSNQSIDQSTTEANQSTSQPIAEPIDQSTDELLDREKMIALLSPYGRLIGMSIKQSMKGGYAQYESAHSSGTAIASLNQSVNFGGKLLVTFAAARDSQSISQSTTGDKAKQSAEQLSKHTDVLSSLRLYKNIIPHTFSQSVSQSGSQIVDQSINQSDDSPVNPFTKLVDFSNKPMFHFGAALEAEDDRFGLPAPKPINDMINQSISQLVQVINEGYHEDNTDLVDQAINQSVDELSITEPKKKSNLYIPPSTSLIHKSSSQSINQSVSQNDGTIVNQLINQSTSQSLLPVFDRITYQSLMPGAGVKPQLIDEDQFDRSLALMVMHSSLLIDVYHTVNQSINQSSNQFLTSIHLPMNSLLVVPSTVSLNYSFGVAYRTRDLVNGQSIKRSKVSILKFLKVRPVDSFHPSINKLSNQSIKASHPKSKQRLGLTSTNRKIVSSALPFDLSLLQSTDPSQLERLHVQDVYDTIASHFSSTRHSPWPRVEAYVKQLPVGLLIADIACGNGKYMGLNPSINMIGCDLSAPLVEICVKKGYQACVGDCMSLPWSDAMFDGAISVALLHHISSADRRKQTLSEMLRVVKPGGRVLVTAWAMEQDETSRRKFEAQDVLVPWKLPSKFKPSEREQAKSTNQAVNQSTNQDDSIECQRYCHVYTEGEIEGLLGEIGGNRVVERYYDRGNWVVIFEKAGQ